MNYLNAVFGDTYNIISKKGFRWSSEFTNPMKLELVSMLIKYFELTEDYEKCAILKPKLKRLEKLNEVNNKRT